MQVSAPAFDPGILPWDLLNDLVCPLCGSRFTIGLEGQSSENGLIDGVLLCDCYEYPVVDGIAVLRQMSPVSSTRNEAVEYLKQKDPQKAVQWLLNNGTARGVPGISEIVPDGHRISWISRRLWKTLRGTPPSLCDPITGNKGFKTVLQATRPRLYAEYLFYRYANPSLLGAIPPAVVFGEACRDKPNGRILDLLCGVGHASALFCALCPDVEVVAADIDYVNLFLAKHLVAPRVAALCVDAELPLPFKDSFCHGFFCLDGLHYIRSKVSLLREVERVVGEDGVWLFAHMHNLTGDNVNPGAPISADVYARRFAFGHHRLMPESEVLHQYQKGAYLDLTVQPDVRSMDSCNALTCLGGRMPLLWQRHADLVKRLCPRPNLFGFNPLYRVDRVPDGLVLRSAWPSDRLRSECVGERPVLPEHVLLPRRVVDEISLFRNTGALSDAVRELIMSFVLVILPKCYFQTEFPG